MLHTLNELLEPALMERLVLLLNHVLRAEAAATARLRPHAGRHLGVSLQGWPSPLPPPPALAFRITPAGLLEWAGSAAQGEPDLRVSLDASNPAMLLLRLAAGERPRLEVQGDAALAADIDWLAVNLRWDLAGDLERLFGPMVGGMLARFGTALASALRGAVRTGSELSQRWGADPAAR